MIAEVLSTADVDAVWPHFASDIVKCLKKTPSPDYSAGDFWAMCRSGMAFVIVVHDENSFVALTIWRFEGDRFACILMVGKGMRHWLAVLVEKASQIATDGGATRLRAGGRVEFGTAFKRLLPKARVTRQTYEVEI